jgi:hypothetical protein
VFLRREDSADGIKLGAIDIASGSKLYSKKDLKVL